MSTEEQHYPQHRVVTNGYRFAVQRKFNALSSWEWFRGFIFSVPHFTNHAEHADKFLFLASSRRIKSKLDTYSNDELIEKTKNTKEWKPLP